MMVCWSQWLYAQQDGLINVDGTELYYRIEGQGEPVVIVHGGPGLGHDYLRDSFTQVSDQFQLIFYDQRGCGRSANVDQPLASPMDVHVDDLQSLLQSLQKDKINLVGQSFGALIAIHYALKYPNQVKRLILLEPAAASHTYLAEFQNNIVQRLKKQDLETLAQIAQSDAFKTGQAEAVRDLVLTRFKAYYYDSTKTNLNDLKYLDSTRAVKFLQSQKLMTPYILKYDLYDTLKTIKTPTLIMRGDYDPIPLQGVIRMHEAIPQSKLHIIKDCGHFAHLEAPEEYFGVLRKFLSE